MVQAPESAEPLETDWQRVQMLALVGAYVREPSSGLLREIHRSEDAVGRRPLVG